SPPFKEFYPRIQFALSIGEVGEEVWVFATELVFTIPCKPQTSSRVPSNLDDRNVALLQPLDLSVHNIYRLFSEMEFVVNLDFFQRNNE
ncbi:hypothetical protein Tco_1179287, partial [Tanacetum coccineum]